MQLLIAIVNYRTAELTVQCLRALAGEVAALAAGEARVVVADNASGDGSAQRIGAAIAGEGWSEWAGVMPLPRNGGFAYGNNAAIRPALASPRGAPRYVLLLNSDTIVRPGAVAELLRFMESHPQVGIVGSRLEDPDGTPQCSAFRFPTVLGQFEHAVRLGVVSRILRRYAVNPPIPDEPSATDWVAGASMMVRREVFDTVGLLDEEYFLYFEEVDFCLRARRGGWPCWYVPASRVVHLVGRSSGVTDPQQRRQRRPTYWFESRRRYFAKNHGAACALLADAAWVSGHVLWRLRRAVQRKPDPDPQHLLGDFLRHCTLAGLLGGQVPLRRPRQGAQQQQQQQAAGGANGGKTATRQQEVRA